MACFRIQYLTGDGEARGDIVFVHPPPRDTAMAVWGMLIKRHVEMGTPSTKIPFELLRITMDTAINTGAVLWEAQGYAQPGDSDENSND